MLTEIVWWILRNWNLIWSVYFSVGAGYNGRRMREGSGFKCGKDSIKIKIHNYQMKVKNHLKI